MGASIDCPRLCGGTFFVLLTQAMKKHGRARAGYGGSQTGISEANLLKDLIRIFFPSYPDLAKPTEKSNATRYKQGKNLGSDFPCDDAVVLAEFDHKIKKEYEKMLIQMNELVVKYIDAETYGEWLVKALLQLIEEDSYIPGDASFYIEKTEVKKENLDYVVSYVLPAFLLGVWHYIIMCIRDNTVGERTYYMWHPDAKTVSPGKRHTFSSSIGTSAEKHIFVINKIAIPGSDAGLPDSPKDKTLLSVEYRDYLESARGKYTMIKTILHDELKPFRSFYVCNGLKQRFNYRERPTREQLGSMYIDFPTADNLAEISNYIVIQGTGGLGKSMMMQHLMLDTIERCDEIGRIPVFIYLKDYTSSNREISEFVYEQFHGRYPGLNRETFNRDLRLGRYLLLFDGMDEINSAYRGQFETRFDLFADANPRNLMVISSRPFTDFINLKRFTVFQLRPFSKAQALELVDKLEFREDEPELKKNFRRDLDKYIYDTHMEFAQNPLLLTFMLMTYERFGSVSTRRHEFYSDVYDLLAKRHDATKVGYSRKMKTGLTPERLKSAFAAFCAVTYQKQKYSFTESELVEEFRNVLKLSKNEEEKTIPPGAFIDDYTNGICLLYKDGDRYFFMHRSFQEYFAALAFSEALDEDLLDIGAFFENDNHKQYNRSAIEEVRLFGDQTFDMLYEMISERVEKFILLPYLTELFRKCDTEDGYWTFLRTVRPRFKYYVGEVDCYSQTSTPSFLYGFIIDHFKFARDIIDFRGNMPFYKDLVSDEFVEVEIADGEGYRGKSCVSVESFSPAYRDKLPPVVGWELSVKVKYLSDKSEKYHELIEIMEKPEFPFMAEYQMVRTFMDQLKKKTSRKTSGLIKSF